MVSCTDNGRTNSQYTAGGESRKSFQGVRRVYIITVTKSYYIKNKNKIPIDRQRNRDRGQWTEGEELKNMLGSFTFLKLNSKCGASEKPEAVDGLKV